MSVQPRVPSGKTPETETGQTFCCMYVYYTRGNLLYLAGKKQKQRPKTTEPPRGSRFTTQKKKIPTRPAIARRNATGRIQQPLPPPGEGKGHDSARLFRSKKRGARTLTKLLRQQYLPSGVGLNGDWPRTYVCAQHTHRKAASLLQGKKNCIFSLLHNLHAELTTGLELLGVGAAREVPARPRENHRHHRLAPCSPLQELRQAREHRSTEGVFGLQCYV